MDNARKLSWLVIAGRTLAVIFLPLLGSVAFFIAVMLVADWGTKSGLFYMRPEATLLCFVPFAGAILAALIVKWRKSTKSALWVIGISAALALSFL